jgi:hypothetical protein
LLDESAKFASLTGHGGLPELRDLMEACRR